jgi:hypothetical protein
MKTEQYVEISLDEVLAVDEKKPPRRTWVDFIPRWVKNFLRKRWLWPFPTAHEEWGLLVDIKNEFLKSREIQKNFLNTYQDVVDPTKDKPYSELN